MLIRGTESFTESEMFDKEMEDIGALKVTKDFKVFIENQDTPEFMDTKNRTHTGYAIQINQCANKITKFDYTNFDIANYNGTNIKYSVYKYKVFYQGLFEFDNAIFELTDAYTSDEYNDFDNKVANVDGDIPMYTYDYFKNEYIAEKMMSKEYGGVNQGILPPTVYTQSHAYAIGAPDFQDIRLNGDKFIFKGSDLRDPISKVQCYDIKKYNSMMTGLISQLKSDDMESAFNLTQMSSRFLNVEANLFTSGILYSFDCNDDKDPGHVAVMPTSNLDGRMAEFRIPQSAKERFDGARIIFKDYCRRLSKSYGGLRLHLYVSPTGNQLMVKYKDFNTVKCPDYQRITFDNGFRTDCNVTKDANAIIANCAEDENCIEDDYVS